MTGPNFLDGAVDLDVPAVVEALVAAALDVYLDGFATGVASLLHHNGLTQAEAVEAARAAVHTMMADPAHRFEIDDMVRRRLSGSDDLPGAYYVPPSPRV